MIDLNGAKIRRSPYGHTEKVSKENFLFLLEKGKICCPLNIFSQLFLET